MIAKPPPETRIGVEPFDETLWSLTAPDLMAPTLGTFSSFCALQEPALSASSPRPPDHQQLAERPLPLPLGIYFENLVATALARQPERWSIVLRNYAIRSGSKTLGELDFLLQDSDGKIIHLETAIKFYLLERNVSADDWRHWRGPNSADRLDRKLLRMMDHQLALAFNHKNKIASALESRGMDANALAHMEAQYLIKGALFSYWQDPPQQPAKAGEYAIMGQWMYGADLAVRNHLHPFGSWQPLQKLEWHKATLPSSTHFNLASLTPQQMSDWSSAGLLTALPMLCLYSEAPDCTPRLTMLVDDHWPKTNSPSRSR